MWPRVHTEENILKNPHLSMWACTCIDIYWNILEASEGIEPPYKDLQSSA